MIRTLSYRFRVPLSLAGVILLTTLVLGSVQYYQQATSFHEDLLARAATNRDNLAPTLVPAIRHNDVWRAYRSLAAASKSGAPPHPVLILADHNGSIFAASHPENYRVGAPLNLATEHLSRVARALEAGTFERILEGVVPDHRVVIAPLEAPDAVAGHLIFLYDNTHFNERVTESAWRTFTSTAAVLALILPIGWVWGRRIAEPLTRLSDCMTRVGHQGPDSLDCTLEQRNDEIGELTQRFQEMVRDLQEKADLERDMVASERLAAVGRLAAGIAHEINNPLGGMLMTLDTLKSRGELDPNARRSVDLIERGLHQIQETVAALLFEAQRSSRHLLPEDIEDVRRLMSAQLQEGRICLRWQNRLDTAARTELPIPATLTRQVLINLLLNAIEATPIGGLIIAEFECRDGVFQARVTNEGDPMPAEVRDSLFAPLQSRKPGGRGLGLWVTQQLVDQMDGTITVTSDEAFTTFLVTLPLAEAEHDSD